MTDPSALITARRASAAQTQQRALTALAAMIRRRERVTFAAVAAQADVSREYLYRTPDLAVKIRAARESRPLAAASSPAGGDQPIVAALREHIRRHHPGAAPGEPRAAPAAGTGPGTAHQPLSGTALQACAADPSPPHRHGPPRFGIPASVAHPRERHRRAASLRSPT